MNKIKMILVFAAVLLCGGAWADAGDVISIDVGGNAAISSDQKTLAGTIPVAGWVKSSTVTLNTLAVTKYNLSSGQTTTIDGANVSWVLSSVPAGLCSVGSFTFDNACAYFKTGLCRGNAGQTDYTLTVSGIPFENYQVYVYFTYDSRYVPSTNKPFPGVVCNGVGYSVSNSAMVQGSSDDWGTRITDFSSPTVGVNAMSIPNQTGSTLTLTGDTTCGAIAAVQIVETVSPTQLYYNQLAGRALVPVGTYGVITVDESTGGYKATTYSSNTGLSGTGVGSFANVGSTKNTRKMIDTHTIAGWFKVGELPTGDATKDIFVMRTGTADYNGYKVVVDANGVLKIGRTNYDNGNYSWNDNKRVSLTGASGAIASDTWFHLALAFTYNSNGSFWRLTPVAWVNGVEATKTGDSYIDINLNGPGYVDDIRMGAGISAAGIYVDSNALSSADVIKAIATDLTYVRAVKRPGFADWSNLDSTERCGTHFGKSGADLTFKLNPTTECPLGTTVAISTIKIANGEKTMANTITINGAVGTKQSATEPFTPLGTVGAGPIDRLYVYQFATQAIVAVGHEYPVEMTSSQLSAINDANSPILISGLTGQWVGYNGYCSVETQIMNPASFSYDGDPSSDWQSTGLEVAQDQATAFLESLTTDYAFAMTFGDTNMDRVPRNGKAVNPVLHDDGVMTVEFQVVNGQSGGYKKMAFVGFKVEGGYLKVKRLTSAFAASSFSGSMVTYSNGTITMANGVTESSNAYPLSKLSATPLVDPVATIGDREFVSLAKALKTAESEATSENRLTVTLLTGVDGDLSVPEWVTVDAGSYEISGKIIIAANAQVTIAGTQTTHGVSGSGKLVKNGTGEVKIGRDSSNNSISDVTVEVNGGALWLGHSSAGEGAALQNCTFVLNGGVLKGYGWPNVNSVTFDCRQDSSLTGSNDGYSIQGGSFTKTGSGTLALNINLRGALTIEINEGSFTVPNNRTIESSVRFSSVVLGSSDTVTASYAVVISDTVSGSGTFNADLTLNAGSTIDVTNGTVSLADGKSLTFPEGELNLVGVEDGGAIISNVTSIPNGLSTVVVKIDGEAVGHLEYDDANKKVIYSTNTVTEVTPNITDGANLDSNRNFIWTSEPIWNTPDGTLPEGARIVFDAAEIHGVVISGQTEAGEIIVKNSDTENHPFVFHNRTKDVDGTHEIDDTIDCLTATSINVEGLNGELGLRVPIKGDIRFGTQTTLKFIASADKDRPSRAYDYSIVGRAAAIQVALDGEAEAGWFVVPVSMYGNAFAPAAGVTAIYASTGTVTGAISGAGKIAVQTETVTIRSTINCTAGLSVESGKAIIPVLGGNELYSKSLTVEQGAELEINEGDWLSYNGTYAFTVSGVITLNDRQSVSPNCTLTLNDGAVINGASSDSQGDWEYHAGAGEGKLVVAEGATAKINRLGIRGSNTVTVSGSGSTLKLPEGVFGSGKITLTDGVTVNVAAGKTASFTDAPSGKILKSTVESDGSTSYRLVDVVAKIGDGESAQYFETVQAAIDAVVAAGGDITTIKVLGSNVELPAEYADYAIDSTGSIVAAGAKIGNKGYVDFALAKNAATTGSEIVLLKDLSLAEQIGSYTLVIPEGITVTASTSPMAWGNSNSKIVLKGTLDLTGGHVPVENCSFELHVGATIKGTTTDQEGLFAITNAEKFSIVDSGSSTRTITVAGNVCIRTNVTLTIPDNVVMTVTGNLRPAYWQGGTGGVVTKAGNGTLVLGGNLITTPAVVSLTVTAGEVQKTLTAAEETFTITETYPGVAQVSSGVDGKVVKFDEATKTYSLVDAVTPIKPGETTEPQQTKPTDEELAQYAPTPVNPEAEAAGQAEILKVVSKQTADGWVITVDLDETKMPEGKKVDDTALAFASEGLAEIAGSTEGQEISIPATAVTPGAYYSIIYGDSPTALSSEGDRSLATSAGVTITVPAMSGKKVQFFRVKASAYPTAN